jgi:hypothetical protein
MDYFLSLSRGDLGHVMKRLVGLVVCVLLLAACSNSPTANVSGVPVEEGIFSDADINNAVPNLAPRVDEIFPATVEEELPLTEGTALPNVNPGISSGSPLEAQAVLPNTGGFIFYIRHDPALAKPWSILRVDQTTGNTTIMYSGVQEIQSVAGSIDGDVFVASIANRIERFDLVNQVVSTLAADTNVKYTDVSISRDSLVVAWQESINNTSSATLRMYADQNVVNATFTQSRLSSPTPIRQPSLSGNGRFLTYIHDRPNGLDQIWRYDRVKKINKAIHSRELKLSDPSITDDGNKIMFSIADSEIYVIDVTTLKYQLAVYTTDTVVHPFITADGKYMTFGYTLQKPSDTPKGVTVYAKNLTSGQLAAVQYAPASVRQFGMSWQTSVATTPTPPPFGNIQKVAPQDIRIPSEFDADIWFGRSLDVEGNVAVVGAPFVSYDANKNGSIDCVFNGERSECYLGWAYILERNSQGKWSIVKQLETSEKQNTTESENFGAGVTVSGNTAVVTSRIQRDANGDGVSDGFLVHIYERNQGGANAWGLSKTVFASGLAETVTLERDTLVIGPFVYERNQGGTNNWGRTKTLNLFTPDSVALSGDTVIVGVRFTGVDVNKDGTIDCRASGGFPGTECGVGAAYIYGRNVGGANNWGLVQMITASDALPYSSDNSDRFGSAVDVRGNIIVVANERVDANADGVFDGGAYVFERNSTTNVWKETQKITTKDTFDRIYGIFGISVSIGDNTIVVGSQLSLEPGSGEVIYIYTRNANSNTWVQTQKLVDTDGGSRVGQGPVILSGNTLGVGDFGSLNTNGKATGAVFFYER